MAIPNSPSCSSTHYDFYIDSNVTTINANDLCQLAESDWNVIQNEWFPGVINNMPLNIFRIQVQIVPGQGGATWCGCPGCRLCPDATSTNIRMIVQVPQIPNRNPQNDINNVRVELTNEVTEVFMQYQKKGWSGSNFLPCQNFGEPCGTEGTVGEGLSLFLGQQIAIRQNFLQNTDIVNSHWQNVWLQSFDRPIENLACASSVSGAPLGSCPTLDYVNSAAPGPDPNTGQVPVPGVSYKYAGYYIVFLYYLKDVLNRTIPDIIAHGPSRTGSMTEVYQNLTGDFNTDPNGTIKNLLVMQYKLPPGKGIPDQQLSPFTGTPAQCQPGWRQENNGWAFYQPDIFGNCMRQTGWVFDNETNQMKQTLGIGAIGQTHNYFWIEPGTQVWLAASLISPPNSGLVWSDAEQKWWIYWTDLNTGNTNWFRLDCDNFGNCQWVQQSGGPIL
ncbi:hypothetical protein BIV60_03445 [Bacillus sp. MUM 116]|uniref:hypothetical protein n=1 Tax=Bacillus sp. MUM 116 TaxID=1678002 RepID=UPI0008F5636B|nr:hypothetical protein [Bacillus sp. MUM 116]OIK16689.1 hypothetical protein BIV60_03445 [Bacillus sp. MUM 116]